MVLRNAKHRILLGMLGLAVVGAAAVVLVSGGGTEVRAQTPPAPCACSRATAVIAADEATPVPGQIFPRYGMIHCQCGTATCVSQIPYGSAGTHQLACVK